MSGTGDGDDLLLNMPDESPRMRLHRIAEPIVHEKLGGVVWDVVGDQRNSEWHLKIGGDPTVQFRLDETASDEAIAESIRTKLTE
jgi:hypothetical protein